MELDILKLVYDYSTKRQLVDLTFINKIIEIVVTRKSLDNYVRNLRITNRLDKDDYRVVCAAYSLLSKEIIVDYESIQFAIENRSYYEQLFCEFEQIMFRNLSITQFILHELEHAYQNKQIDDKSDNSIEAKLAKASFMLEQAMKNPEVLIAIASGKISAQDIIIYVLHNRELYKQYYKLNPTERLAQIKSFKTIGLSLEPIKEYIPNLYEFQKASLIEEMLKGYQDSWTQGCCPTEVYLYGVNQGKIWTKFDFYNPNFSQLLKNVNAKYELERRLTLGLPVSYEEFNATDEWLQGTNKFNL